jgi:hypothetical protein
MSDAIIIEFECHETFCGAIVSYCWSARSEHMSCVCECGSCAELYAILVNEEGTTIYELGEELEVNDVTNLWRENPSEDELKIFENPQVSKCDVCGIEYDDFRTGETFQTVLDSLWVGIDDPEYWNYKGRHSVLGRWHEIKQTMWADHLKQCEESERYDPDEDEGEVIDIGEY